MWVLWTAALADCPDLEREVSQAHASLTVLNLDGAARDLESARQALGCGPRAETATLARLWAAEGVLAAFEGDFETARIRFAATRRHDAELDLSPFGEVVANTYAQASVPDGTARVELAPPLSEQWLVALDGQAIDGRIEASAGVHAIQILDPDGPAHLARILVVDGGDTLVVEHDLPDAPPEPPKPPIRTRAAFVAGVGTQILAGNGYQTAVAGDPLVEPTVKVVTPATLGVHLDVGRGFGRLTTHFAPLLNGSFVYAGDSVPRGTRWAWGLEATGGARLGSTGIGLTVGARLPSRLLAEAMASLPLAESWRLEPALGVALPTDRGPEPTVGVDLLYRFDL